MYLFIFIILLSLKIDIQVWCGHRKSIQTWRLRGEAKKQLAVSYKGRGARVFQPLRILHLFHVHSFSQRHSQFQTGVGAFGNWNFCSSARNGLQTCRLCVPFHGTPFFFFFASSLPFFISHFVFWIEFKGPHPKPSGSRRILAHCSPGMLLFLSLCRIGFFSQLLRIFV